jgi:hypothetical protein
MLDCGFVKVAGLTLTGRCWGLLQPCMQLACLSETNEWNMWPVCLGLCSQSQRLPALCSLRLRLKRVPRLAHTPGVPQRTRVVPGTGFL